jgi:hypothetical protein
VKNPEFLGITSYAKSLKLKISPYNLDYLFQGSIWDLHAKFQRWYIFFSFFELFLRLSSARTMTIMIANESPGVTLKSRSDLKVAV